MKGHMRAFGICRTYNRWIYHGESLVPPVVVVDEHMRNCFDFDEIERDPQCQLLKGGIEAAIIKRYRGRKTNAKTHFTKVGGANDVEETKKRPPPDMESENWKKAVDYFCSESHKNRSAVNIENRKLQKYTNRGGTTTYSSYGYKKNMNQLQTFKKAHTRRDGTFDNEQAEQQYNEFRLEFESQTEPNSDGEYEECSEPLPNAVPIFQKVLCPRRGVMRGIGLKPKVSLLPSSSGINHDEQEHTPPPPITQAQYANLFQDPNFIHCLDEYINQRKGSSKGNEDDSDEDEDDPV